jgi:hypothetical protein
MFDTNLNITSECAWFESNEQTKLAQYLNIQFVPERRQYALKYKDQLVNSV